MSFKFPPNSVSETAFLDAEPIITPDELKVRYLFGLDLSDENGNELPRETIQHAINSAVSYLEHKLDIIIKPRDFLEKYDLKQKDYTNFNFLQLKKRPLRELKSLKAKLPSNRELINYPPEWFTVEKESSQIQLAPTEGTFSSMVVSQGGSFLPLLYGTRDYWPHLFEISYSAGFDNDCIPIIINEMIGMQAAIRLFEILGDIVLSPGLAGESVGLDGANTSKNTTASAMYSAFSARVTSYKDQMKDYISTVKSYYNGLQSVVV